MSTFQTNGETFVPLSGLVDKLDTIHNQEDNELPGIPLLGTSNEYLVCSLFIFNSNREHTIRLKKHLSFI